MAQYTTSQIQAWISRANKCLYKLGLKSTDEKFFEDDNRYDDERVRIYMLKKAVSWFYQADNVSEEDLNKVVSLLISRITIYDWGKTVPLYETGETEYVGLDDDYISGGGGAPSGSTSVPDDLTLVGGTDITVGVSTFSDSRLSSRFRIVRNNIPFYDWYKSGNAVFLTGIGDQVTSGDVFVFQYY